MKKPPPMPILRQPTLDKGVVHGRVKDEDVDRVSSNHARINRTEAKVRVVDGKLVRKMPAREKTAIAAERDAMTKGFCICGCGRPVISGSLLSRGHYRKMEQALTHIESGELTPEEVLRPSVVQYLGPWVVAGPGLKPSRYPWRSEGGK